MFIICDNPVFFTQMGFTCLIDRYLYIYIQKCSLHGVSSWKNVKRFGNLACQRVYRNELCSAFYWHERRYMKTIWGCVVFSFISVHIVFVIRIVLFWHAGHHMVQYCSCHSYVYRCIQACPLLKSGSKLNTYTSTPYI